MYDDVRLSGQHVSNVNNTDTQRHRHGHKDTHRHTHTHRNRQTDTPTYRLIETHTLYTVRVCQTDIDRQTHPDSQTTETLKHTYTPLLSDKHKF